MFVLHKKYFEKYDLFFSTTKTIIFNETLCFKNHFCYSDIDKIDYVKVYQFSLKRVVII